MEDDWREVTTFVQLMVYLNKGEIVMFNIEDGNMCIVKEKDKFSIKYQPKLGSGTTYSHSSIDAVKKIFQELQNNGIQFWVLPGTKIISRKLTFIEKFIDFIRKKD